MWWGGRMFVWWWCCDVDYVDGGAGLEGASWGSLVPCAFRGHFVKVLLVIGALLLF